MSIRGRFEEAEWRTLEFSPYWIWRAMATADGKADPAEVRAFQDILLELRGEFKDKLAREVLRSIRLSLKDVMSAFEADPRNVREGLTDVADILDRNYADRADDFKRCLCNLAMQILEASPPGWEVGKSTAESGMLGGIASALRYKLG